MAGAHEVKGGPGGFYTKREYAELVAYARDRFIMVIPEIDMPSHSNAALASYPELNCNGVAPPLYTGIDVGFSNFCFDKEITFKFLDDVLGELAAMTPGPYLHIGGDEVKKMTPAAVRRLHGARAGHRREAREDGDRVGRDHPLEAAAVDRHAVLAAGRVDGAAAGNEADSVAGEQDLSGHEIRRQRRARPELGGQGGRRTCRTTGTRRRT